MTTVSGVPEAKCHPGVTAGQGHLCPMTIEARDLRAFSAQRPLLAVTTNQGRGQSPSTLQTSKPSQNPSNQTIKAARASSKCSGLEKHSSSCVNSWLAQSTGHAPSFHGCETTQWFPGCIDAPAWAWKGRQMIHLPSGPCEPPWEGLALATLCTQWQMVLKREET